VTQREEPGLYEQDLHLQVSSDSYIPEHILVPRSKISTNSSLFVRLRYSYEDLNASMNELAKNIATIQWLISKKDLFEAQRRAELNANKFSQISISWDLLGNTFYLQKNLVKALEAYKKSAELDPQNSETQKMIQHLSYLGAQNNSRQEAQ
jgi:tetratricopeptide (TPR) repeat protein